MKKSDKIVALIGVIIIILAAVGIYFLAPLQKQPVVLGVKDFADITGQMIDEKELPSTLIVSNKDPFYALIATPLAISYDENCSQRVVPLLISKDVKNPSSSVTELVDYIGLTYEKKLIIDDSKDAKNLSLEIASNYWKNSEAALVVEYDQSGYEIGLIATPFASYLRIPIIVTDKIDEQVKKVFNNLGVRYTIICGNDIEGYGNYLKFDDVDEIVDASIEIVNRKFKTVDPSFKINYITLANPIDAWPPKVIGEPVVETLEPTTVKSVSMNRQNTIKYTLDFLTATTEKTFKIPEDFKYALIEIDGYNHELDGVDTYGDSVEFSLDPVEEGFNLASVETLSGIPTRDSKGNIIEDKVHIEVVLYDCGGKEYKLSARGSWSLKSEGKVSAVITIKKLEHPRYEFMKGLSTVAPYLTAYRKGIIFAKSDFAFAADDEAITSKGERCPGFFLPGRNPKLVPVLNKHIYDNIHQPLNKLLAKLADIPYERPSDLEKLTDYYKNNPVYIALVGGSVALPRYIYQNDVEPIGDVDGDGIDDSTAVEFGGGGTNSDNIYGDIDPVPYEWSNLAGDVYSKYPYLENIVGRITGYDAQDASQLIVRTIFYEKIIERLGNWKNKFGNLNGGGLDFRKPLWVQILNHMPGLRFILNLAYKMSFGFLNLVEGPWKSDTGFGEITAKAIEEKIGKNLGFEVETAVDTPAMIDGLSDKAIDDLKKASLWNRLTFSKSAVKEIAGEGVVRGRSILENSNFIWITGHGCPYHLGLDGPRLVSTGYDGIILNAPRLMQFIYYKFISPYFMIGFWGPGGNLGKVGDYCPRKLSTVKFGPSFLWLESCFCGRITGITPETNVGQAFLHAGVTALVASDTGSNIAGGYLEPKNHMYDTVFSTWLAYRQAKKDAEKGIFPDFHFGTKIYSDMCQLLKKNATIGEAFRDAKNKYLPEDAEWKLWWSPPLCISKSSSSSAAEEGYGVHMPSKYTSFFEYSLYADPAFNPYVPNE